MAKRAAEILGAMLDNSQTPEHDKAVVKRSLELVAAREEHRIKFETQRAKTMRALALMGVHTLVLRPKEHNTEATVFQTIGVMSDNPPAEVRRTQTDAIENMAELLLYYLVERDYRQKGEAPIEYFLSDNIDPTEQIRNHIVAQTTIQTKNTYIPVARVLYRSEGNAGIFTVDSLNMRIVPATGRSPSTYSSLRAVDISDFLGVFGTVGENGSYVRLPGKQGRLKRAWESLPAIDKR